MSDFQQQTVSPDDSAMASSAAEAAEGSIFELLGMDDTPEEQPRDNGRFAKKPEPVEAEPPAKAPEKAEPEAKAEAKPEDQADDEIEDPTEIDGDKPKRYKLSDVLAGFKERGQLAAQLEEAKNRPIIAPEQWDRSIAESVWNGQRLAQQMEQWQRAYMPVAPDPSQYNDMQSYQVANEIYRHQVSQWQQVDAERQQIAANVQKQQEALDASRRQRNLAVVQDLWPELKNAEAAKQVQNDLVKHFGKYGVTKELIGSIDHPAFYAIAKAALKGLQAEAVKEQAAKVVQAKPKLIKGQARSTSDPRSDINDAFAKLAKSGKAEDAYAMAERFFI